MTAGDARDAKALCAAARTKWPIRRFSPGPSPDRTCPRRPDPRNAHRVLAALRAFGAPVDDHGLLPEYLHKPGMVYQVGIPPQRIDFLTRIDGVDFDQA